MMERTNLEIQKDEKEIISKRPLVAVPCATYSRIVGYLTATRGWHQGKQQEFVERQTFRVPDAVQREEVSQQTCD